MYAEGDLSISAVMKLSVLNLEEAEGHVQSTKSGIFFFSTTLTSSRMRLPVMAGSSQQP